MEPSTLDIDLDVDNLLSFDLNTQLTDLNDFNLDVANDVNLDFEIPTSTDPTQSMEDEQALASLDLDKLKADLSVLTAQSMETSDLPSFELSSVQELFHPHLYPTDSKIGGFDGNNNNNNNSDRSIFVRGSANVDISIDDVLDLTSPDLALDIPLDTKASRGPSDSLLPFDISPPSTPTLERSLAFSNTDKSLLENNEYLQDLGLTENGKLFVDDDDTLQSPLFRKVMQTGPNSPGADKSFSVDELNNSEENEYDIYDDDSMLLDINLNDLDNFDEIDKQFFAMNRSRSNSVANKQTQQPAANIRTSRTKMPDQSNAQQQEQGSKGALSSEELKKALAVDEPLQDRLNQKIQEKLSRIAEEERNRSNSVSAPESLPKTDNVPPVVPRQDRSNSISEGVSVQTGVNSSVVMEKAAPNIKVPRRLSVGTLQENEALTNAAPPINQKSPGSRPTTPSPKSGSKEGSANSSRNNSRPSSRNSDTKVPSGFSAKSPSKPASEKASESSQPDTQETLDAASKLLSKAKIASPLGKTIAALPKAAPKKSASLPVAATKPRSSSEPSAPENQPATQDDTKTAAPNIKIPAGMKMSFLPPANTSMGSLLKKSKEGTTKEEDAKQAETQQEAVVQDEESKPGPKIIPKSALKPQGSPSTPRRVKFNEKTEMIDKDEEDGTQEEEQPKPQPATSNLKTVPGPKAVAAPTTPSKSVEEPSEESSAPTASSNLKTSTLASPKSTGLAAPKATAVSPKVSSPAPAKAESPAPTKSPAAKTTGLAAPKTSGLTPPAKTKATATPTKPAEEEDDLRPSPPPTTSPAKPATKTTGLAAPKTSALTPPKSKVASPAPKTPQPQEEEDDLRPTPTASPAKPATKTTGLAAPKSSGLAAPKSKLAASPTPKTAAPVEEEDDLRPSPPPTTSPAKPATKTTGLAAPKSALAAPKSTLTPPKAKAPEPAPAEDEEDDLRPSPPPAKTTGLAAPKASGLTPPKSGLAAPKASGLAAPKKTGIPSPGNKK